MTRKPANYQNVTKGNSWTRSITFQPAATTADPALEALRAEALALFDLPFNDLLFRAHTVHREHFDPNRVQRSTLLSIKTGGCPEDCGYCPQAARYHTGVENEDLLPLEEVRRRRDAPRRPTAPRASAWAPRGAARRRATSTPVLDMVRAVKALGLETCCTLGMLKDGQAEQLRDAGLDYYNHNLDTAPEHYGAIITTRDYQDRLDTLERVRHAGLKVCCGGIVGLGEIARDARRAARAAREPRSRSPSRCPINELVQVEGTPLAGTEKLPWIEFVRTIAVARILMPASMVRLSAGRTRDERSACRRCASSPAPIRSSTARSCSPRAIPTSSATTRSSPRSASQPA